MRVPIGEPEPFRRIQMHDVAQEGAGFERIARSERVEIAYQHIGPALFAQRRRDAQDLANLALPQVIARPSLAKSSREMHDKDCELLPIALLNAYLQQRPFEHARARMDARVDNREACKEGRRVI